MFILISSVHNFADDRSLSNIAKTIDSFKQTLESECKIAIRWFHEIKMIVNPDKFQAKVLDKPRSSNNEVQFIIDSEQIQAVPSVNILGITTDNKLNFNLHIEKNCLKSANPLNALVRLKRLNSFMTEAVNIWTGFYMITAYVMKELTNAKSVHKIEATQKRTLHFILNDYGSSYEDLLKNSGNPSMNLRRTRLLCKEIYKTIKNLNPEFMKNLFKV